MKYQRPHPSTQEIGSDKPNFAQETYLCLGEQPLVQGRMGEVGVAKQDNALRGNYDAQYIQMEVIVILIIQSIQGARQLFMIITTPRRTTVR